MPVEQVEAQREHIELKNCLLVLRIVVDNVVQRTARRFGHLQYCLFKAVSVRIHTRRIAAPICERTGNRER